ncbi:hypothetical protein [Vibrio sp. D431a]|uniref:hypothetical protein n=1 Tax=Vibrio sp. D431a TaxID=2837388 RepID=UPI002553D71E|nr:hypothetical protein [Vibrio sp. D431a]MDK9793694.1 hypothetical protein [Vibrio sp. D431a]
MSNLKFFLKKKISIKTNNDAELIEAQEILFDLGFYWLDGTQNQNASPCIDAIGLTIGVTKRISGFTLKGDIEDLDLLEVKLSEVRSEVTNLKNIFDKKFTKPSTPKHEVSKVLLDELMSSDLRLLSESQHLAIKELHKQVFG